MCRRRRWLWLLLLVAVYTLLTGMVELSYLSLEVEYPFTTVHSLSTQSHLCPAHTTPFPVHCTPDSNNTVVVIGALSFVGSRIAADLTAKGLIVHAFTDIDETGEGELVWYRKQQLQDLGVEVTVLDLSNRSQIVTGVVQVLSTRETSSLVHVPTVKGGIESEQAEKFVKVLEIIREHSPCTRVFLVSDNTNKSPTDQMWMESIELMLSAYHSIHSTPSTFLRLHGVYGPWADNALTLLTQSHAHTQQLCWYITDVTKQLYKALTSSTRVACELLDFGACEHKEVNLRDRDAQVKLAGSLDTQRTLRRLNINTEQLHTVGRGVAKTITWARAYISSQPKRNIVFTSYFTALVDPQRDRKKWPDRFSYLSAWYLSVVRLSLNAVIFHDGLSPEFQHKLALYHPGVSFELVPSLNGRSTNDARFFAYLHYLERNSGIDKVILTDISDVQFQMDPFELMGLLGDQLYIGTDIDIFPNMQAMPWIHQRLKNCFGNSSVEHGILHPLMEMDTVYNAGVIGGNRAKMLSVLSRIVEYLNTTPPHLNCNMPAVNVAVHKHFFDSVFTGYPLTSRFLRRQQSPKGVYIVHK